LATTWKKQSSSLGAKMRMGRKGISGALASSGEFRPVRAWLAKGNFLFHEMMGSDNAPHAWDYPPPRCRAMFLPITLRKPTIATATVA
jgi:hypothetical protein